MKICKSCNTNTSVKWRSGFCNNCYLKRWRKNNKENGAYYDASLKRRFNKARGKAKIRKLGWSLSLEEFTKFCSLPCYYCENKFGNVVITGSGLDRINNKIGYNFDNVLPCCGSCNLLRGSLLSVDETKKVVELILQLRSKLPQV